MSVSRVHFLRGTGWHPCHPQPCPLLSPASILTECLLSVWLCRERPQISPLCHHTMYPIAPTFRSSPQTGGLLPSDRSVHGPVALPPPHRLRPTLSLLHGGHDAGPRDGLVETAQDLLPHSGAQLVRDFHHLHDPAQQRSAGTSWGCGGRAGRATRRKEGRSRKETPPASAPGQKVGRTSLDVLPRPLGAEQAQKSNMHSGYAGRSRGADPCPVPGPVPYSMKGKLFPLGLHPPALVLIHRPLHQTCCQAIKPQP